MELVCEIIRLNTKSAKVGQILLEEDVYRNWKRLVINKNTKFNKQTEAYGGKVKMTPQHIYFVTNRPINEDDWYIDDKNQVRQSITSIAEYWEHRKHYKKIIRRW